MPNFSEPKKNWQVHELNCVYADKAHSGPCRSAEEDASGFFVVANSQDSAGNLTPLPVRPADVEFQLWNQPIYKPVIENSNSDPMRIARVTSPLTLIGNSEIGFEIGIDPALFAQALKSYIDFSFMSSVQVQSLAQSLDQHGLVLPSKGDFETIKTLSTVIGDMVNLRSIVERQNEMIMLLTKTLEILQADFEDAIVSKQSADQAAEPAHVDPIETGDHPSGLSAKKPRKRG